MKRSLEVQEAMAQQRPIVALESTIISHGMPYPQNVETAKAVEQTIRDHGATPATIAILGGEISIGLTEEEIEWLGKKGKEVQKTSRRDIAVIAAKGQDGSTTVAATMYLAHTAGIDVFATGGIGGVHRNAEKTMDISADLEELSQTPVIVVCAGAKAILDLRLTLEYLETKGVCVLGYQTEELPAFYSRESGLRVDYPVNNVDEVAAIYRAMKDLNVRSGLLVTNPVPQSKEIRASEINEAIEEAIDIAISQGIQGKDVTPFLLDFICRRTEGKSLETNIALIQHNAKLGAEIARALQSKAKK